MSIVDVNRKNPVGKLTVVDERKNETLEWCGVLHGYV
jgi:hypothetical protein